MHPHFLIIANGPFLSNEQLRKFAQHRTIIALDGAADRLLSRHIKPDVILGDFDSLYDPAAHGIQKHQSESFVNAQGILIVPAYDQMQTDLQKAIDFCDAQQATAIDIVCATDGRFDHAISNIRVLKKKHKKHRPLVLHVSNSYEDSVTLSKVGSHGVFENLDSRFRGNEAFQSLVFLKDESYEIHGKVGELIGVFGFPNAVATSRGLKYEMDHYELKFAEQDSSSNELLQEKVLIKIKGEALLVGPFVDLIKAN